MCTSWAPDGYDCCAGTSLNEWAELQTCMPGYVPRELPADHPDQGMHGMDCWYECVPESCFADAEVSVEVNGTGLVESTDHACPMVGYRYRPSTFGCRCASSEAGLTEYPYTLSTGEVCERPDELLGFIGFAHEVTISPLYLPYISPISPYISACSASSASRTRYWARSR